MHQARATHRTNLNRAATIIPQPQFDAAVRALKNNRSMHIQSSGNVHQGQVVEMPAPADTTREHNNLEPHSCSANKAKPSTQAHTDSANRWPPCGSCCTHTAPTQSLPAVREPNSCIHICQQPASSCIKLSQNMYAGQEPHFSLNTRQTDRSTETEREGR